jgi:ankyrin repeat protein
VESIKWLVAHGAKKGVLNEKGETPLDTAISLGFLETFEELFDNSILAKAIFTDEKTGEIEAIGRLMKKMSDESRPPISTKGNSPFYYASWNEDPGAIVKMLQKEKELNFRSGIILESKDSGSALCHAAEYGYLCVVEVLAENLEVEIWDNLLELMDEGGRTPPFLSVYHQNPKIFSYLVDHGANVRFRTRDGRNLLYQLWRAIHLRLRG